MKKYISKFYILLILALLMTTVSCDKVVKTEKIEVTEDGLAEEAIDEANVTPENTIAPESTEAFNTEPTVIPEPTEAAEPTVTIEPIEITAALEEVEPSVSSDLETIEETVLFDRDGVRVTAKEMINDFWGKCISVLVENDTDKNIGIQSQTFIVNNYMSTNFVFSSVAPGTESTDYIPLYGVDIKLKEIDIISDIAVSFLVFDNDSGDNLFLTDEAVIQTSAYGTVIVPEMPDGKELLNQDGVRIVGKYVDANSSWGTGVLIYIENTTDQNLLFQCDDMLVNGISIYPFFSVNVNQGREAQEALGIMDFDLSDNNITEIKDIKLTFSGIEQENYNVLYTFELPPIIVGE